MNTLQNNGGAAFPQAFDPSGDIDPHGGMTLRDWFAGQAIHTAFSYLQDTEKEECETYVDGVFLKPHEDVYTSPRYIAAISYDIADAMIAERNKRQNQ